MWGRISASANARTLSRTSLFSSVRVKSTIGGMRTRPRPADAARFPSIHSADGHRPEPDPRPRPLLRARVEPRRRPSPVRHRRQGLPRLRERHRRDGPGPRPSAGHAPRSTPRSTSSSGRSTPSASPSRSRASRPTSRRRSPTPLDSVMFLNSGLGGDRRGAQARPARDRAAGDHRVPRRLPRADVRGDERDDLEPQLPDGLRAVAPGRLLRAVPDGLRRLRRRRGGRDRGLAGHLRRAPRDRHRAEHGRVRSSSSRSSARAATSRRRSRSCRGCASAATSTASCSSPTRSRPASGGPGRCGRSSTPGSSPTSSCLAKAIANGLPLSAIVSSRDLQERWGRGAHGSTYGGNPVACAAGIAVLETIRDEGLVANARRARRGARRRPAASRGRGRADRRHPGAGPDGRRRIRPRQAHPRARRRRCPIG